MMPDIGLETVNESTGEVKEPQDLVIKAMVKAWGEIGSVVKDRENTFHKNKYATLDAILAYTKPILASNGLALVMPPTVTPEYIKIGAVLYHESGQMLDLDAGMQIKITKNDAQGIGSAITYGKRYQLSSLFGIATEDDDDGNRAAGRQQGSPSKQSTAARVKQQQPESIREPIGPERAAKLLEAVSGAGQTLGGLREYLKGLKNMDAAEVDSAVENWPDRWSPQIGKWIKREGAKQEKNNAE